MYQRQHVGTCAREHGRTCEAAFIIRAITYSLSHTHLLSLSPFFLRISEGHHIKMQSSQSVSKCHRAKSHCPN